MLVCCVNQYKKYKKDKNTIRSSTFVQMRLIIIQQSYLFLSCCLFEISID